MNRLLVGLLGLLLTGTAYAQNDPEFPKGWVMYFEAQQGLRTTFDPRPDLFATSASLCPQITVVPAHFRIGGSAGLAFTDKQFSGMFGPRASLKLKTIRLKNLGSLFNLQLELEHLWGTRKERLFGGDLKLEIIQLLSLKLSAHRDHALGNWWFMAGAGINLFHKKRKSPTGDDPFD